MLTYSKTTLLLISGFTCAFSGVASATLTAPQKLQVPPLSSDAHSIVLTWKAPANTSQIADYRILQNNKVVATALKSSKQHAPARAYIDAFYKRDSTDFAKQIVWESATIDNLKPSHSYQFQVRAVDKKGNYSPLSQSITVTTTAKPTVLNITNFGAKGDGKTLNTDEIQNAINACTNDNCEVLIPKGTFKTGALYLKSNMTLYLAKGAILLGSTNASDYPSTYKLYTYSKTKRPASLINAIDSTNRKAGTFNNIRIVGHGVIDGNGWKHSSSTYKDTLNQTHPNYLKSNRSRYKKDGILAKNQVDQAITDGLSLKIAYGQMRSSLMTLRGVNHLYIAGITVQNPANHGIMVLTSKNIAVNGVTFRTYDANNGDGIELGNSSNAMVFNSYFDTGDDSINFAAGTGQLATKQPAMKQAWLFNNFFHHGHGAVVIGSHTGATITNILAENNVVDGSNIGLRAKSSKVIGGGASQIVFRNTAMANLVRNAVIVTLKYSDSNASIDYPAAKTSAHFEDFEVRHVTVAGTTGKKPSIKITGDSTHNIWNKQINFDDVKLDNVMPTDINDLKNSHFNQVVFTNLKKGKTAWKFSEVDSVTVDGKTVD
ncbi:MAG: Exo-poly-alpha-D-galacturonosidase [Candidatus Celerinatantimonas neptuna]|nr:MAG: Exo-poly-alpha-D-galacturonosidase [Candidatus Celerinatantimonas neptuna]